MCPAELDPEALAGTPPGLATRFGDSAAELLEALQAAGFQYIFRRDAEATFALPANCWWQAMMEMPFPLSKIVARRTEEASLCCTIGGLTCSIEFWAMQYSARLRWLQGIKLLPGLRCCCTGPPTGCGGDT